MARVVRLDSGSGGGSRGGSCSGFGQVSPPHQRPSVDGGNGGSNILIPDESRVSWSAARRLAARLSPFLCGTRGCKWGGMRFRRTMKKLVNDQKKFIRDHGFLSFLSLSEFKVPIRLVEWVMQKMNPDLCEYRYRGKVIVFDKLLTQQILGLRDGNTPVKLSGSSEAVKEIKSSYHGHLNNNHLGMGVCEKFLLSLHNEEKFVMTFMIYLFGTILCPATGNYVNMDYFYSLISYMDHLKNANYCTTLPEYAAFVGRYRMNLSYITHGSRPFRLRDQIPNLNQSNADAKGVKADVLEGAGAEDVGDVGGDDIEISDIALGSVFLDEWIRMSASCSQGTQKHNIKLREETKSALDMFKKCMMDLHAKRTEALSKDASCGTDSVRSSPSSLGFVMEHRSGSLVASDPCDAPSFNLFDEIDPEYISTQEMKDSTVIVLRVPSPVAQSSAASKPSSPLAAASASRAAHSTVVVRSPSPVPQSPTAANTSTIDKRARKDIDDGGADEKKMRTTTEVENVYMRCVTSMPNRRSKESSSDLPPPFFKLGGFHVSLEYFRNAMKTRGEMNNEVMAYWIEMFNEEYREESKIPSTQNSALTTFFSSNFTA
uniref:Uncharacterized protein n=1 Tax=Oryza punctata TaxID=4537 RepID=A0A0E0KPE5_ORYPU